MMRSLFSAVSGLKSNQTAMDIIGNNIANVNTIAYKTSRTVFQDIFSQTIATATAPTADTGGRNAKQVGLGTNISTIGMTMTEGSTQSTSNPLDFAISGEGFFVIADGEGGYMYTRNGAFQLDKEGYLVTANGHYVMAITIPDPLTTDPDEVLPLNVENGTPILDGTGEPLFTRIQLVGNITRHIDDDADDTTPAEDDDATPGVTDTPAQVIFDADGDNTTTDDQIPLQGLRGYAIDANGKVTAINSDGTKVTLGRLVMATFSNASGLEKIGSSYYVDSPNSGDPEFKFVGDNCGTIESGSLEMSNVDLANELTNMIITQRGFQANSRVITTTDTMLEELINLKR
jgi:flagellar hook protein FlgE